MTEQIVEFMNQDETTREPAKIDLSSDAKDIIKQLKWSVSVEGEPAFTHPRELDNRGLQVKNVVNVMAEAEGILIGFKAEIGLELTIDNG